MNLLLAQSKTIASAVNIMKLALTFLKQKQNKKSLHLGNFIFVPGTITRNFMKLVLSFDRKCIIDIGYVQTDKPNVESLNLVNTETHAIKKPHFLPVDWKVSPTVTIIIIPKIRGNLTPALRCTWRHSWAIIVLEDELTTAVNKIRTLYTHHYKKIMNNKMYLLCLNRET